MKILARNALGYWNRGTVLPQDQAALYRAYRRDIMEVRRPEVLSRYYANLEVLFIFGSFGFFSTEV